MNHTRLVERILEFGEEAIREILQRLRVQQNATFLELAIRVLFKSGLDCFDEVCDIVDKGPRRAYQISLLCMLLGFTGDRKYARMLWNYYQFFRYCFREETYADGPLLGLLEIRDGGRRAHESTVGGPSS